MADSKKKALIQAAAEMIRKAGAANVSQDTELVHVTPEEKAKLKAAGGSGKTDPTTGLPHFDGPGAAGTSKAEPNKSKNDNKDDDDLANDIAKGIKDSMAKSVQGVADKTAEAMQGKTGLGGNQEQLPSLPSIPNVAPETPLNPDTLKPYQEVTRVTPNKKNAKIGAAIGGELIPGFGAILGYGAGSLIGAEKTKHLEPYKSDKPAAARDTDAAGSTEANASVSVGTKAPVADETLKETVAAPTFDDFVGKARKKKNYMSTILGGGVPAGTPQGKKLLGS